MSPLSLKSMAARMRIHTLVPASFPLFKDCHELLHTADGDPENCFYSKKSAWIKV